MRTVRYDFSWSPSSVGALLVLAVVWGLWLLAVGLARPVMLGDRLLVDQGKVAAVAERINPNIASVASLRRLGGVGPVRAQAIADFAAARDGEAFAKADDLTAVVGVGPGTVERISPYLVFGEEQK